MKNILLVTSSPRGEASYSSKVATQLAHDLGGNVVTRDVASHALPAIGEAFVHASYTPEANRTSEQKAALELSDTLIAELKAADVIVIGAAMINFGMPANLKTWVDLVSRSGVTFRYGETGPEGLVTGKTVKLVIAAGGVYSSGPMSAMNHLEPALRTNLGFIGLTDVETVWIEGVAYGPEATEQALISASEKVAQIALAA